MATTITRPTRTDDTGTPATPNNDGDIVDASTLTTLEDNIDGMWSGATQVFGGTVEADGFGVHDFNTGGTGANALLVGNPTSGTGNSAELRLGTNTNADVARVRALSSAYTTAAPYTADGLAMVADQAGGIDIAATEASADIRLAANGSTKLATFSGDILVLTAGSAGTYGLSGLLRSSANATQVGTDADVLEKDLHTYTLPAGSLGIDGQTIRYVAQGTFQANTNTKTIRIYFGATVALTFTGDTDNNGGGWRLEMEVQRTGAAAQKASAILWDQGATAAGINLAVTTPGETLSGAVVVKVTGQNGTATANDIVAERSHVEFLP